MEAQIAAWRQVLDELYDGIVGLLPTLDEAALTWAPLADGTNTIAALVRHTVGATDNWLARAVGEPIERDRAAEFGYRGGADELIRLVERSRGESRRRLEALAGLDLAATTRYRRSSGAEAELSRAWCVEHAIAHAGEHWGQIQLTAQLHRAQTPS